MENNSYYYYNPKILMQPNSFENFKKTSLELKYQFLISNLKPNLNKGIIILNFIRCFKEYDFWGVNINVPIVKLIYVMLHKKKLSWRSNKHSLNYDFVHYLIKFMTVS